MKNHDQRSFAVCSDFQTPHDNVKTQPLEGLDFKEKAALGNEERLV